MYEQGPLHYTSNSLSLLEKGEWHGMAPAAPHSHYDFLLGHPIKHEKVILALSPLSLSTPYVTYTPYTTPTDVGPPVCGICGGSAEATYSDLSLDIAQEMEGIREMRGVQ